MEQLTQMEFLKINELLGAEELSIKKYQAYSNEVKDDELQPYIQESINLHQQNLSNLLELVRKNNGKDETQI
ncbi:MAG: hypothetical protein VR72_00325 [Clostridiaceae bacterium BRH_c20a]|nr:MAG: hypothetical protein VR72_00325 [Clostridiaceae bacterium BRH_c20a]